MRFIVLTILISLAASGAFAQNPFKAIKPGQTIKLKAGAVVQLEGNVYIPSGVTITTDWKNPATIKRAENARLSLCVQGENITIENVILDYAMLGKWRKFASMISFKIHAWSGLTPDNPIKNIKIDNVKFINSSPPKERERGDCWAISLAHNSPEALRNIRITNCQQLAKSIQLVGNGQGHGGIRGLEISHNYCQFGKANSIAVSTSSGDNVVFEDFLIADNELLRCEGLGIFVGLDGGKGHHPITMRNIEIVRNIIEVDTKDWKFPFFVYVRTAGPCTGLNVSDNTMDSTLTWDSQPRWLTLFGQEDSPAEYRFENNTFLGSGSTVIRNAIDKSQKK